MIFFQILTVYVEKLISRLSILMQIYPGYAYDG